MLILINHGDCSDSDTHNIALTTDWGKPSAVFQQKLKILIFIHFTTCYDIHKVFMTSELGITTQ